MYILGLRLEEMFIEVTSLNHYLIYILNYKTFYVLKYSNLHKIHVYLDLAGISLSKENC